MLLLLYKGIKLKCSREKSIRKLTSVHLLNILPITSNLMRKFGEELVIQIHVGAKTQEKAYILSAEPSYQRSVTCHSLTYDRNWQSDHEMIQQSYITHYKKYHRG